MESFLEMVIECPPYAMYISIMDFLVLRMILNNLLIFHCEDNKIEGTLP